MSRKQKLTEQEQKELDEFFAGFSPAIIKKPEPLKEGDQVMIIGDHPHRGKKCKVIGVKHCPGAGDGLQLEFIPGESDIWGDGGCFVFDAKHIRRI